MKKVLYDTNVLLDALVEREPFWMASVAALTPAAQGKVEGYLSGHTVTTLAYLLRSRIGAAKSKALLADMMTWMNVAPVTDAVIHRALAGGFDDFEDAVTHEAALEAGVPLIVTRDLAGFRKGSVRAVLPEAFSSSLRSS